MRIEGEPWMNAGEILELAHDAVRIDEDDDLEHRLQRLERLEAMHRKRAREAHRARMARKIDGKRLDLETKHVVRRDPEEIECSTHLLFITKNLERVGDHATNIAEVIEFQLSGVWKTTQRPKGGDDLQSTVN